MSENILNNIITKKIERVDALKKSLSLDSLNEIIDKNNTFIDFKEKIQNNIIQDKISIIAEIKIGRAHVRTPVTSLSRMPSSA